MVLELWYYQSLVSANESVCMKPIWEVMQLKFYFGNGAHVDNGHGDAWKGA